MGKYLTSIMKVLPAVQAQQITKLLEGLRANGEVRDAEEYEKALKKFAKLVNAEYPQPLFKQIRALVMYLCNSDAHNTMMLAAKNDIEALFLQTNEIGQRLDGQHSLMMDSIISDLDRALNEQRDTIKKLRIVGSKDNEFSNVLVNSFSQTSLKQINRSEAGAELLFFDNRTGAPLGEEDVPSAYISPEGQKLLLPTSNEPKILPVSVRLMSDSESYGSDIDVVVNNSIQNVIDGTTGTYWTRVIYLESPVPRVSTVLEFDLGTGKDINYCVVEGASQEPFYISEMWGVCPDGSMIDLFLRRANISSDSLSTEDSEFTSDEVKVEGSCRIDFEQVFVKAISIKFTYSSYDKVDFYYTSEEEMHDITEEDFDPFLTSPEIIATAARKVLVSKELADVCGLPVETENHINKTSYTFALDNVWFGNGLYHDSAIYVSEPVTIDSPGVLSINTQEVNVGTTSGSQNCGSVEYEIIRQSSVGVDHFPCPFLGQIRSIRERLVLFEKQDNLLIPDVGCLRFCPRVTIPLGGVDGVYTVSDLLTVYRNGSIIDLGDGPSDYQIAYSQDSTGELIWTSYLVTGWNDFSNWNLPVRKLWIKINTPSNNDIYTVDYQIRNSNMDELDNHNNLSHEQCIVYIDAAHTIYMGEEGRLIFSPDPVTGSTSSSLVYVQITLRRNSASSASSPEVREYMLLAAPFIPQG